MVAKTEPTVPFQLQIEVRKLRSRLKRGCIVFFTTDESNIEWKEIARTEEVVIGKNYKWIRQCIIDYSPQTTTLVKAKLFSSSRKGGLEPVGVISFTLSELVLSEERRLVAPVKSKGNNLGGEVVIYAEEVVEKEGNEIEFSVEATSLRKGKLPYFEISRELPEGNGWYPVVRSEANREYTNAYCLFRSIKITSSALTNNDHHRRLRIEFYDVRAGLSKDYTGGSAVFTVDEIMRAKREGGRLELTLSKVRSRNQQNLEAGSCAIVDFHMEGGISFQDALRNSCLMNTMFAIDFSATNGDVRDPNCPHYINAYGLNEYESILREVGYLLASYDTCGTFPAWGFSARLPENPNTISQCFPLSDDDSDVSCGGIDGVHAAYKRKVCEVIPERPCLLTPVLEQALSYCREDVVSIKKQQTKHDTENVYNILLVLTDGDFDDFDAANQLLSNAAELAVSILVVSVGNAECSMLRRLDSANSRRIDSAGVHSKRKVQYIPFRKFRGDPARLAAEVFREIPSHVASYMKARGVRPSGNLRRANAAAGIADKDKHSTHDSVYEAKIQGPSSSKGEDLVSPAPDSSIDAVEAFSSIDGIPISFAHPALEPPQVTTSATGREPRPDKDFLHEKFSRMSRQEEEIKLERRKVPRRPRSHNWRELLQQGEAGDGITDPVGDIDDEEVRSSYHREEATHHMDFKRLTSAKIESQQLNISQQQTDSRQGGRAWDELHQGSLLHSKSDKRHSTSTISETSSLAMDLDLHPEHMQCAQRQIRYSVSARSNLHSALPTAPPLPPVSPTAGTFFPARGRKLQQNVAW